MYSPDAQGFLPATSSPQNNCANIPSDFPDFSSNFIRQGHRMAHAAATNLAPASAGKRKVSKAITIVAWAAIVAVAIAFVLKYVFHYYLH
jgi:hypothetical protein